ncbi:hypothetical protein BX600DRAFT_464852 [Xylariales sp. PMI_506]|nr:hypothetical protein BX600DRAFT_464852 [Xylariales sp. PMI_506]
MLSAIGFGGVKFDPARDIPPLEGKVFLVTGANRGIGKATALELARHRPARIWLACRNAQEARDAATDIARQVPDAPEVVPLELDLGSFGSIRRAAAQVTGTASSGPDANANASAGRLDCLILNAGVMCVPPALTESGYELHFGTNHMGHALLTRLLLPTLLKSAEQPSSSAGGGGGRVIVVASWGHNFAPEGGIHFDSLKGTTQESLSDWERYGQSKLSNVLFAREMAKRYPQITTVAVHPGPAATNVNDDNSKNNNAVEKSLKAKITGTLFRWLAPSPASAARNQLWATVATDIRNGEYYIPVGLAGKGSAWAQDDALAHKLWEWTENELKDEKI